MSPDIDHDDVADLQLSVRISVVRIGAMWTGSDDDECHCRMPLGNNRFGNAGGNLRLGAAGHQKRRYPGMHPINGGSGLGQRVHLGRLLDHPQLTRHIGSQYRQHPQRIGQRQQVQGRHRIGNRGSCGRTPNASATSWYGSSPSTQSRTHTPKSDAADSLSDASSKRGKTMVGTPEAGSTSAVSRSNVSAREPMR